MKLPTTNGITKKIVAYKWVKGINEIKIARLNEEIAVQRFASKGMEPDTALEIIANGMRGVEYLLEDLAGRINMREDKPEIIDMLRAVEKMVDAQSACIRWTDLYFKVTGQF